LRWRRKKKKKKKARRFYLKGVASDWQWRGLGVRVFHWICLFSSKETGLVDYLSTNGLGPLGLFGRGI
jgi:hypothetical protein